MKYKWTPIVVFYMLVVCGPILIGPFINWFYLTENPPDLKRAHELETLMIVVGSVISLLGLAIGFLADYSIYCDGEIYEKTNRERKNTRS